MSRGTHGKAKLMAQMIAEEVNEACIFQACHVGLYCILPPKNIALAFKLASCPNYNVHRLGKWVYTYTAMRWRLTIVRSDLHRVCVVQIDVHGFPKLLKSVRPLFLLFDSLCVILRCPLLR